LIEQLGNDNIKAKGTLTFFECIEKMQQKEILVNIDTFFENVENPFFSGRLCQYLGVEKAKILNISQPGAS